MNGDGNTFYAVVVVLLLLFLALSGCLGFYLRKRMNRPSRHREQQAMTVLPRTTQLPVPVIVNASECTDDQTLRSISEWQSRYPPDTRTYVDVTKHPDVIDKGVLAWKFIETESTPGLEEESNAAVSDDDSSTIIFCQGQGSIMTNLPVPAQEFSYFEIKILQHDEQNTLAIGFATKPYPRWRLPGWHRHSVAYHSNSGAVFASDPHHGRPYGPPYVQGDVIGVGYLYQSGTVFFTRNGLNLGKASIGFRYPIYPVIGSIGPSQVSTNFGTEDFLFTAANQREAAYGPRQGSLLPPPAYGGHKEDALFEGQHALDTQQSSGENLNYVDRTHIQLPPPSYS